LKQVFVQDIQERDRVESPFLVRDKILAMAKNGKPYMTLKLMDRSGEIEGRVWDRVDEYSGRFEKDDFIFARGKASVYMGKMQLIVQELERIDEREVNLADFLPVSQRPLDEMESALRQKVASMDDPNLRALLESFLADDEFLRSYLRAPAAKAMHHVYLGGLLEHSLAVADLAEDISARYPGINRDLLVAGALLHDVGKVGELSYQRSFDYTDEGKLLGHIVMGVEMVEERIRQLDDFPARTGLLLKHLLLSHHGQYEYGSPKRPMTMEAVILNFIDDLDSKINGVRTHIEKEPDSAASWTAYHRLYDRYFYKEPLLASQPEAVAVPAQPAAAPVSAASKKGQNATSAKRESDASTRKSRKPEMGFTLGDQLKGKSLDLFSADDEKKEPQG